MEVQALLDATPAGLAAAKLLFPVDDNDKAAAAGDQRAAPHHVDDNAESLPPPQQQSSDAANNASSWASLRGLAATSFGSAKEGLTSLGSAALTAAGQLGDVVKEQMGGALCGFQPLVWGVPTKLQNSLARSNQSRFG